MKAICTNVYHCTYLIAVLVNTTLFILFGKGLNGELNPSLLSIDVANVANISYTAIFNAPSGAVAPPTNNNSTDPQSSSGLSSGAIGGIVAGVVVAVSTCQNVKFTN